MKTKDVIRELERNGFVLVRNSEHKVFKCGDITACVPHARETSPGMVHGVWKAIKQSKLAIAA